MNRATERSFVYRRRATARAALVLALVSLAAMLIACALGSASIPLPGVLRAFSERLRGMQPENATHALILFKVRLPRILMAFCAGAALSIAGVGVQGVFQNPMADPYLLGVSSGAALGAALAIVLNWQAGPLGYAAVSFGAFAGGTAALFLVLALSGNRPSSVKLLLAGVAVSAFLSALLSALLSLHRESMETVYLWMMGSFTGASWSKVAVIAPIALVGALGLRAFARDLNAMLLGEADARSLGISVPVVRMAVIVLSTAVTATAVSMCGIVGFVGLMVPHAARMLVGPDHRGLMPVALLGGGLFMLIVDTLARTVAMPLEIPVGILTSLMGGPFFLMLLRRQRHA
ncbi:MAG: iron ABC transporter permease [Clostridiales bacterium]|nr:iron ABC transporter permease [Clostridiales bacterium]